MPALRHRTFHKLRVDGSLELPLEPLISPSTTNVRPNLFFELTSPNQLFLNAAYFGNDCPLVFYTNGDISFAVTLNRQGKSHGRLYLPPQLDGMFIMGNNLQEMWIRHFDRSSRDETVEWDYVFEHTSFPSLRKLVVLCGNFESGIFEAIRTSGTLFDPPCPALEELCIYFPEHIAQVIRATSDRATIASFLEERQGRGHPLRMVYIYDARPPPLLVMHEHEDAWRMSTGGVVVECARPANEISSEDGGGRPPGLASWLALRQDLLDGGHFVESNVVFGWLPNV